MPTALESYEQLAASLRDVNGVTAGQMFGKACLKTSGKAFVAQHLDTVVFKLNGANHAAASRISGAVLWDPSEKGRPMKEWVALPAAAFADFSRFATAALGYVSAST